MWWWWKVDEPRGWQMRREACKWTELVVNEGRGMVTNANGRVKLVWVGSSNDITLQPYKHSRRRSHGQSKCEEDPLAQRCVKIKVSTNYSTRGRTNKLIFLGSASLSALDRRVFVLHSYLSLVDRSPYPTMPICTCKCWFAFLSHTE